MKTDRPITPECECREGTGVNGCRSYAQWAVGIGSRRVDRQLSCGRHLNRTCVLMLEAEKPRNATLTVIALGSQDIGRHEEFRIDDGPVLFGAD